MSEKEYYIKNDEEYCGWGIYRTSDDDSVIVGYEDRETAYVNCAHMNGEEIEFVKEKVADNDWMVYGIVDGIKGFFTRECTEKQADDAIGFMKDPDDPLYQHVGIIYD